MKRVLCACAAGFLSFSNAYAASKAHDIAWPTKPVRVIVPSAAAGGADIVARAVTQRLTEAWGQQFVVDNRPGALGAETAARAAPDGYTIMFTTSALAVRESVYTNLPYNTARDFAPVTQVVAQSNVLVTHPALPVRTVKELVAYAKARPGELNYGSSGNGSSNHLAVELLCLLTGVKAVHVAYKGVPQAIIDLMAGRLQFLTGSPVSTLPQVKDGKLRLLAVTTPRRSPSMPDVPTIAESVPGYEFTGWMGMFVPVRTPRPVIVKLHREVARIVQLPDVKQRFAADAADAVGSTPEEFAVFLKAETARWARVAKEANIRAE